MKMIAAALVLASTPAFAENGNWQVGNDQVHVVDDTIDVATLEGRSRLLARVERAADKVCRNREGNARRECEVETVQHTAQKNSAWGRALGLALAERNGLLVAAR